MPQPKQVSVRDLRNHIREVLGRVEAGETLEVTVNERPVALLVPRNQRPSTVPTRALFAALPFADPGLHADLAGQLTATTEDETDLWRI